MLSILYILLSLGMKSCLTTIPIFKISLSLNALRYYLKSGLSSLNKQILFEIFLMKPIKIMRDLNLKCVFWVWCMQRFNQSFTKREDCKVLLLLFLKVLFHVVDDQKYVQIHMHKLLAVATTLCNA